MTLIRRPPPLGSAVPAPDPPAFLQQSVTVARLLRRSLGAVLVTLLAAALQAVLIALPGSAKRAWPRWYWTVICRVLDVSRNVVGTPLGRTDRPVLFVSNHTTWLDIPTLGATLQGCFVSKAEVGRWPVVSTVAKLGRTVFVSRRPSETGRERDHMRARLASGDNLVLFPEGTSSDGARTLPFRTTFFALAESGAPRPIIQPVSIVYDRIDGLPVGRAARPITSWYGDMDLGRHFLRLARIRRIRATILLHPPIDPADYPSRKELSRAVWDVVATGAAGLRQNRPVPVSDI